jgi:5-methylcytosine-specific restriction endonuclease McrA
MSLERRRPLRRGKPLDRGPGPQRRSRIRHTSGKRRAETDLRRSIVEAARERDGGCVAFLLVPEVSCFGPLDGDEIIARSAWPGGHLILSNVQTLCRAHHDWKHDHPEEAHERGLLRWSWERNQG